MRAFHFLSEAHALQALKRQRLKVATINELNDPFELLACDVRDKKIRRGFKMWKDRTAKTTGLLCFSRGWRNPLLWSQYADRHRGVALEFEIDSEVAVPVQYQKRRIRLDVALIMATGGFTADLAEKLATTKSAHWSYEEEIRVTVALNHCDHEESLYFERMSEAIRVTALVVGSLSKLTAQVVQLHVPGDQQVKITWARPAFGTYDIVRNKSKPVMVVEGAA